MIWYGYADQTDFELRPLAWKNIITAQTGLKSVPSFTDQTRIDQFNPLYPCEIIMKQLYLIYILDELMKEIGPNGYLLKSQKSRTSLYFIVSL